MALVVLNIRRFVPAVGARFLSTAKTPESKPTPPPQPAGTPAAKPAASAKSSTPVGPGASKDGAYKNPEYYNYNPMSFYDIEKDMKPFRLPQPSSKKQ